MTATSHLGRRRLLQGLGVLPWTGLPWTALPWAGVWGCQSPEATLEEELWVSAQGSSDADFGAGWVGSSGHGVQEPLGFRGHDVIAHPRRTNRVLVVARSPGRLLAEVDVVERRIVHKVECAENHHHNGHACFSMDGDVVFTAESDFEAGQGRIVVRDARDYRVLDIYDGPGIGPHELKLMPDGRTLVVAVGGLLTHPDTGSELLNGETMRSRLAFVDSQNGDLLEEFAVDEPKASIRHLDVTPQGEVSVALQMQREASDHDRLAPLCALYTKQRGLVVLSAPDTLLAACNDYMGSTRVNVLARTAAFSTPRGDLVLFWNLDTLELSGYQKFHDVCGLAVTLDQGSFVLSNSSGQLRFIDSSTLEEDLERRIDLPDYAWDNHLLTLDRSTG